MFNDFAELQYIEGNLSNEINSLASNLWISHDLTGARPWVGLGRHRPTHLGGRSAHCEAKSSQFSTQKCFITDRNTPQFHQLSGWLVSDDPASEMPDVEVLGWHGYYMWSADVRPGLDVLPNSFKLC